MAGEKKEESLIYFDDLTGFFNRRYLYVWLPKEIKEAQEQKRNVWLLMLDIDNFKMINDTYGHLSGDQLIKDVSVILKENTKALDKKARYAGDEFTVIFSNTDVSNILSIARRLVKRIDSYRFKEMYSRKSIHITVSIGIAGCPQDTTDHIELINLADKALYISKQKGKNCVSTVSEISPDFLWKKDFLERFPCQVLAGRKTELSRMAEALQRATKNQASFLLFSGDLGIGKSRLLAEFERKTQVYGATCLSAKCVDKFMNQPFYILGELLDGYLVGLDKLFLELLEGIPETELYALCGFMPVLKDLSGTQIPQDYVYQENQLSAALRKLLLNISKNNTLCITFDDFQYVDVNSLEVIYQLMLENKNVRILMIASFSSGELTVPGIGESPLAEILKAKQFKELAEISNLIGLNQEEVKEMISSIFPTVSFTPEFVSSIYRKTKGNPLFVEELSKYCIEKELISYKNGTWLQKEINDNILPSSIEEVIKSRLMDLDEETKEMIAKAAVIGKDFQIDLLREIDSQDRGYVLDLIEGAKKVGLIYGKGSGREEEFSFVSNGIRDVLFKAIDSDRVKQLYLRVGEIKEKQHPDKLNSIAGELYYNFKKAEDATRAEQYAKMIKDGKASLYERTIKYAQSLLEEAAEETILLPLSKEAFSIAVGLVKSIYMACVNYLLYPPQNKMRLQAIEDIYMKLSHIFSEIDVITIAVLESSIIVNNKKVGKELPSFFARSFISTFNNADLESISFLKGATIQELTFLIDIITNAAAKEENISELLKEKDIVHIVANELVYDISSKKSKEKENLQEMMLVDYLLGKIPFEGKKMDLPLAVSSYTQEIAHSLEQLGEQASKNAADDKEKIKAEMMAKSIQKIGEQFVEKKEDWTKNKEGLAKIILSFEPDLRARILANQPEVANDLKGKIDVIKDLSLQFPDEVILDVLKRQYLQPDMSITKMKGLIDRFLPNKEKKDKITPLLETELKQAGISQKECGWIFQDNPWDKLSLEDKVKECMDLPITTLLKLLPPEKMASFINELISSGQEAHIELVMDKFIGALEEKNISGEVFINYFKEVMDIIAQEPYEGLLLKFMKRFSKFCFERDELISVLINLSGPHINRIIQSYIESERYTMVKKIMQGYAKDTKNQQRFPKVIEEVISKLIEELMRMIESSLDWSELIESLLFFKKEASKQLIERALFEEGVPQGKYFEAYLRRCTIGRVLNLLVDEEIINSVVREKFFAVTEPYLLKNLIEIIGAMGNEDTVEILKVPLGNPDPLIRRKTIFTLGKLKGKESARFLGKALLDQDAETSKESLQALKNRKDEYAFKILQEYTKNHTI